MLSPHARRRSTRKRASTPASPSALALMSSSVSEGEAESARDSLMLAGRAATASGAWREGLGAPPPAVQISWLAPHLR